jgi:hypothetical protein
MSCAVHLDYHGGTVFSAAMLALGIGLAYGIVQGFLVAFLDIQPFIVTLAGMFFAKGMTTIVNNTQFNVKNAAFQALKATRLHVPFMGAVNKLGKYVPAYVEIGVVVALLVVAVLFFILRWTKLGRSFYAVGGSLAERHHAGGQCPEDEVHRLPDVQFAGRYRRLRLLPPCRFGFSEPRDGSGNERHRLFDHRRDDAHRWCGEHHRYVVRRLEPQHHQEHRDVAGVG